MSLRQFVYMILKDNKDLDLTLNVKVDDFNYAVFARTKMITVNVLVAVKTGHLVRGRSRKTR